MYVPLACKKDEFNPVTKEKIGVSEYNAKNGWIEGYVERWLDDPSKEHISILGEFGTGKTWLTLHYAWTALQKYRSAKERGIERPRIPLVIPLRDYAKAVSVESLFSEFFFRKYEIPLPGYSVFEQLNRMGKLLLIFDGFDEMADRVDSQKMINNFWELARVVVPGSKAILTCRTEHFPEAKEGRALLNAELKASISALTGEPPQFEVLELEKFNDDQIRQVLCFRAEASTVEEIMSNSQLLDLARRPVMTELILEALPEIEAGKPVDMARVYLYAVSEKMKRDIKAERTFTSLADKLYFLCELSWEMLSTDQMSLNYRLFPDRLRRLFGHAVQEQKNLDHWHYDMMGQTMLIRNADGDYMPAHRSLLEFFVAYKFSAELGVLAPDFLELAQEQSYLSSEAPAEYTWTSYFQRSYREGKGVKPISPLKKFTPEEINALVSTIGKAPLFTRSPFNVETRTAILALMENMISSNREEVKESLLHIIKETCCKPIAEVGVVGGNTATILCRYNAEVLKGENLTGANLRHADFTTANLSECDLSNVDLSNARFGKETLMRKANLRNSNLENIYNDTTIGWISAMPVNSSYSIKRLSDLPSIHFLYPGRGRDFNRDFDIDYSLTVYKGEILIFCLTENKQIKWEKKIQSVFILQHQIRDELLHLLTIEGENIIIDTATGKIITNQESDFLRTFQDANFTGVQGLSERNIYIFETLGGLDLPGSSYDPQEDETINLSLQDDEES